MRGRTISRLRCSATFRRSSGCLGSPLRALRGDGGCGARAVGTRPSMRYTRAAGAPRCTGEIVHALLLQVLCTVRSERLMMEQLDL